VLHTFSFLFLTVGFLVLVFTALGKDAPLARTLGALCAIVITLRYAWWRLSSTIPEYHSFLQNVWTHGFLFLEMCAILSAVLFYFFLSQSVSRSQAADAAQNSDLLHAPTDIFIATYNESRDILERTVVGALAVDHPDFRVWLLDDGDRPWVREMAASLGIHYVSRSKGKHAKAGNINHGVEIALSTGRRPRFMLLLDADFVPHRIILKRTLGLFEDPTVGIVQTPQHFVNSDPVQSNLLLAKVWPDEQRFFFNVYLPAKDAWGTAFCCGTSAVLRVDAFLAAGGMATATVTEDMLTSFAFRERGYRTIYLNERLSLGLASESLAEFITQRTRWCLGSLQQIYTRWSFLGSARLGFLNRLGFFDTIVYWIFLAPFKILVMLAPLVYWFAGTAAIRADAADLFLYLAPVLAANLVFMHYAGMNMGLPGVSDVTGLLTAFPVCRTALTALVRPFGRTFKVTAKGLTSSGWTIHWRLMIPFVVLALLNVLGIALHASRFSSAHGESGYTITVVWSLIDVAILGLAAVACVEPPRRRRDERFETGEGAVILLRSALGNPPTLLAGELINLSLGGALVRYRGPSRAEDWKDLAGPAELVLQSKADRQDLSLPFTVVDRQGTMLRLQFHEEEWIRHALIRKLFTGDYHRDVAEIRPAAVMLTLARNLVS